VNIDPKKTGAMVVGKVWFDKELDNLQQRYDAVFTQHEATLNEGDKLPLEMLLEQLEKQVNKAENELSQL
jgi:hypothetical protein